MTTQDGTGREEGGRVQDGEQRGYLWRIQVDVKQNQYNILPK